MTELGNGLHYAELNEDALSVREAELSMLQRLDASEEDMLAVFSNLADTCRSLGNLEKALRMERDVYSGYLTLFGEEDEGTLYAATTTRRPLIS